MRADLERIDGAIRSIAVSTALPGTRVDVAGSIGYPPQEKDAQAAVLVERYSSIVRDVYGAEVVEWSAGGVTVGNFTAEHAPTIDALAVEMAFEHDLMREYADLATFEPRLVAAAMLIAGGC